MNRMQRRRASVVSSTKPVRDNHCPIQAKPPMTGISLPNPPQGYVQLTEGRIRTTDLIFATSSTAWSEPHAFVVGSDVGEGGTKVARRVAPLPKSSRSRS
jgi:hypothetical protein